MPKNHKKIVLDLEFNPIRDPEKREIAKHEIIEIGAVMLDDEMNRVSTFQQYVRPQFNELEPKISKLTGITAEMLAEMPVFEDAMLAFLEWIGEEPFTLYAWSDSDRLVMLDEVDLKAPENETLDCLFVHWVDLQKIYQRIMGFKKSMGLANALGTLKIYFEGKEHGALADAINTAEVMRRISDPEVMKSVRKSDITFNGMGISSGFTMGGNITIKKRK